MKRSRLKRRTPLKRGDKPLKKTRLKPQSDTKAAFAKLYAQKKKDAHPFQYCAMCHQGSHKDTLEPHHHSGRIGYRILEFVWMCKACHDWVHANGTMARAMGWLQPAFDGRPDDGTCPKPWLGQS